MQRPQMTKVHANGLRLGKLKTVCHRPPVNFIEAKLELPLNGGHAFATVAHTEVVHVHATGHTSGDGVCNAVDLKAKEGAKNAKKTMCMCIGSSGHLPRRRDTARVTHCLECECEAFG